MSQHHTIQTHIHCTHTYVFLHVDDSIPDPPKDFTGLEPPPYCMPPDSQSTLDMADGTTNSIIYTEPLSLLSNFYPELEQDTVSFIFLMGSVVQYAYMYIYANT